MTSDMQDLGNSELCALLQHEINRLASQRKHPLERGVRAGFLCQGKHEDGSFWADARFQGDRAPAQISVDGSETEALKRLLVMLRENRHVDEDVEFVEEPACRDKLTSAQDEVMVARIKELEAQMREARGKREFGLFADLEMRLREARYLYRSLGPPPFRPRRR